MTEYNKAQRACIDLWNSIDSEYCDKGIITEFLEEFNAIDPSPDPLPRYSVIYSTENKDGTGISMTAISDKPNITCKCYLLEKLRETVDADTGSLRMVGVEWVDGEHLIVNKGEVVCKWTIVEDKDD